jgi:hypothetical protein
LSKVKGIVARGIKMSLSGKEVRQKYTPELRNNEARKEMLSAMDYERATNLIYFLAMKEIAKAVKEGRLKALYPIKLEDKNNIGQNGLWVTRGRLATGLTKMFGAGELPLLMSTTRTAELVMIEAHSQHHRGAKDTMWRSRSMAWIVQGKKLAKKVCCNACLLCRIRAKKG